MTKVLKTFLWMLAFTPLIVDNTIFTPANGHFFMRTILFLVGVLFLFYFYYSKDFRREISQKASLLLKNPLTISLLVFLLVFILSTIFAVDKYVAFWGNPERMIGLTGLMYFFSFFVFGSLLFKKNDWLWFFKLSLFTGLIMLSYEFIQSISGVVRPGSFFGNSAFLSGYLLFPILSSFVVFSEVKSKFWGYFSILIFLLSILGIFLTETRGTILGLAIGFVAVLIYGALKGKGITFKKFNLRLTSIIILCFLIVFSSVFILTRKNEVWQKVPGLSRLADISSTDISTNTRLLNINLSINAVSPQKEGWGKFFIGWGPDNFRLAYGKYFNPEQFDFEKAWFDRAHNQLLDVLVMNGVLGLLAYLAFYFFFLRSIFKIPELELQKSKFFRDPPEIKEKKDFTLLKAGLLFFSISFFVHLLFLFDLIGTSIPLFAVLAFILYLSIESEEKKGREDLGMKKIEIFFGIFFSALTLFIGFVFIRNDFPAYIQIREYDSLRQDNYLDVMSKEIDSVFTPFTTAQNKIRRDFLNFTLQNYDPKNELLVKLSNTALSEAEDYAHRQPLDLQFLSFLAMNYTNKSKKLDDPALLQKGEKYLREILSLAPSRLDVNYNLALNLFYQGRLKESYDSFEKIFNLNPRYFSSEKSSFDVYSNFIKYFYDKRDKENFIIVADRLKENNYPGSATLDQVVDFLNKTKLWPYVNFK